MPHLQAVHWMISSVVPVKLPVTRWAKARSGSGAVARPGVWLNRLLTARHLGGGAHAAPGRWRRSGARLPGGSVRDSPVAGGAGLAGVGPQAATTSRTQSRHGRDGAPPAGGPIIALSPELARSASSPVPVAGRQPAVERP